LYSFHDDSPYIFPTTKTTFFRPTAIKRKERKKLKEKKRNEFQFHLLLQIALRNNFAVLFIQNNSDAFYFILSFIPVRTP